MNAVAVEQLVPPEISAWAVSQTGPGSFIDLGAWHGSVECLALQTLGYAGLFIDPAPDAAAYCAEHHCQGKRASVLCAAISDQGRKVTPMTWTPDAPLSVVDRAVSMAGTIPIAAASVHPNEMFEFWDPTAPVLPAPRFAVVDVGAGSLHLLDLLSQWVRIDALRLTVADNTEAAEAGRWLSAAWKIVGENGLSVTAVRLA